MFYRYKPDGDMLRQSAGLLRREDQVAYTADLLAAMKVELSSHGTTLLVAPPPNSSTIYEEKLPAWARSNGRRTEYDLFLDDLATRRVTWWTYGRLCERQKCTDRLISCMTRIGRHAGR
jgi:hypothetical protein